MYSILTRQETSRQIELRCSSGLSLDTSLLKEEEPELYLSALIHNDKKEIPGVEIPTLPFALSNRSGRKPYGYWTQDRVTSTIRDMAELSIPLSGGFVQKHFSNLYCAARHLFSGWGHAVCEAGFNYSLHRERKPKGYWTKKRIVQRIRALNTEDRPLNAYHAKINYVRLYGAAYTQFGGWAQAVEAAGIIYSDCINRKRPGFWTKNRVLKRIHELAGKGEPLNAGYINCTYGSLYTTALKFFNKWAKAVEDAGYDYASHLRRKPDHYWTRDIVIETIRKMVDMGIPINSSAVNSNTPSLLTRGRQLFGSWADAVNTAGFDYLAHCKIWSHKAWLRSIEDADFTQMEQQTRTFSHTRRSSQ